MIGTDMASKVAAMAGRTVTTAVIAAGRTSRHGDSLAIGIGVWRLQCTVRVMTGRAGVMNLIHGRAQRHTCRGAGRGGMAVRRRAVQISRHQGGMVAAEGRAAVTESTCTVGGIGGVMVNRAGRIGSHRVTGQTGRTAAQARGIAQQGTTINAIPSDTTGRSDMTVETIPLMDNAYNVGASMTVGAVTSTGLNKVGNRMAAVSALSVRMAVKTFDIKPGHDDILYRSIGGLRISRPSGVVAQGTAALMQGKDAINTGPLINKERIRGIGTAAAMTGITGRPLRQVGRHHGEIMARAMVVSIKTTGMTVRTLMRQDSPSNIGSRADQHTTADATQVTVGAAIAMSSGDNLTKRRVLAEAADTMAGLTGGYPGEFAVPFDVAAMAGTTIVMTVKTADIRATSDDILHPGIAGADIGGSC